MGLRLQKSADNERFMRFFSIVQNAARKLGKVFFFWSFEGNDIMTDEIDGGDCSGWLVDEKNAAEFDRIWRKSTQDIPDCAEFVIARCSEDDDGSIKVRFE